MNGLWLHPGERVTAALEAEEAGPGRAVGTALLICGGPPRRGRVGRHIAEQRPPAAISRPRVRSREYMYSYIKTVQARTPRTNQPAPARFPPPPPPYQYKSKYVCFMRSRLAVDGLAGGAKGDARRAEQASN